MKFKVLNINSLERLNFIAKLEASHSSMVTSVMLTNGTETRMENTSDLHSSQSPNTSIREDFSEYVAHLQLHMALQARKLVPTLTQVVDSREQLLQQTQANFEKLVSRAGY